MTWNWLFCPTNSPKTWRVLIYYYIWQRKAADPHFWEAGGSKCISFSVLNESTHWKTTGSTKLCNCANVYDKSMNQTRWLSPASPGFLPKRIYSFIWGNQYCHPYCSAMQLTQLKRTMLKARLLVYLSWERPFTKMLYTIKVSAVTFLLSYSSFTCTLNFGDGFCTTERWKAVLCVLIISDYSMSPHAAVRENINYFLSGL